jgi:hypothetical protein
MISLENKNVIPGGVEKIFLERRVPSNCALGRKYDTEIVVVGGSKYAGQACLARMDVKQKPGTTIPYASFLTTEVPENFAPLLPEQYVTCGLWERDMFSVQKVPFFREIEQYFNPGRKHKVVFLQANSCQKWGRYRIDDEGGVGKIGGARLLNIVHHQLPDPYRFARLIVAEGEELFSEVVEVIKKANMIPIKLQRLK